MKIKPAFLTVFLCLTAAFSANSFAAPSPLSETLALLQASHGLEIVHANDNKASLYWQVEDDRRVEPKTLEILQRLRHFLQSQSQDQPWYLYVAVFNKKTGDKSSQQTLASSRYKAKNILPFLKEGQFALHDIQVVGLGSAINEQRILVNIGQGTAPLLMRLWVEEDK